MRQKMTVPNLIQKRHRNEKIVALTAYDYTTAYFLDQAEVDMILVGDSLATTFQGMDTTLPVTLDEMIYHAKVVARGVSNALVVCDLPFMSYQQGSSVALESAGRVLKESGVSAVKLEGGRNVLPQVKALVEAGIPVVGHLGLTPQSYHVMGGHVVQAKTAEEVERIVDDAIALQEAGIFAIVLEGIPSDVGSLITESLKIPTIGIGAGAGCSGQILVTNDLLGFAVYQGKKPKFVKPYADVATALHEAVSCFREEVSSGIFPDEAHSYRASGVDTLPQTNH